MLKLLNNDFPDLFYKQEDDDDIKDKSLLFFFKNLNWGSLTKEMQRIASKMGCFKSAKHQNTKYP